MTPRRLLACSFGAVLALVAAPALATPDFPETLQERLDMPCVPQCVLCHETPSGGLGTARKPFVDDVLMFGGGILLPNEPQTLRDSITNMERAGQGDADHDGVLDIVELRDGSDPNVPGEGNLCGPKYGCGARIAPHNTPDSFGALGAGLVAAVLALAMRRARRRSAG